jgi:hypothetical protein
MESAAEFLAEPRDFLHVFATPSVSGDGWDVVVRIDGTYPTQLGAQEMVAALRDRMEHLVDVSNSGRDWWNGPPWKSPT